MNDHMTQPLEWQSDTLGAGAAGRPRPAACLEAKRELDRMLDQALEDTFPASDPVSIAISGGR